MSDEPARFLRDLLRSLPCAERPEIGEGVLVRGITADSRKVAPGDLFVAIPGTRADGAAFVREAVRRGAVGVIAERPLGALTVPALHVADARGALATLAAAWHHRPEDRLTLVGITGSLGKTSVLTTLGAILDNAGIPAGTIGSLGAHFKDRIDERTRHTTPDPLKLHRILADMADAGATLAAMEVTSHALAQERAHGLAFALGIFTNLVLLEHLDYHGSFREYVAAKRRFFDHLRPGAPLVYPAADRILRTLVPEHDVVPVGCASGSGRDAAVRTHARGLGFEGTDLWLRIERSLPRVEGGRVEPTGFGVRLRLLGRAHVAHATLAAAAALCLGAGVPAVRAALAALPSPRRRMEVLHRGRFAVLDDTVGHPDSISMVFELTRSLPHRRLHAVFAIRGRRGIEINRRDAGALAVWADSVPLTTLVATSSADATDEQNLVEPAERDAFLGELGRAGVPHAFRERLEEAVPAALGRAGPGDLVLLLGAQGMNAGAEIARRWLEGRG